MRDYAETDCCRVCGLYQGEPIYGLDGHSPTFNICDCCGVEFGYEDTILPAIYRYRGQWIQTGCLWHSRRSQPEDWNLAQQMTQIPLAYR
jgi:hypothetical protein